MFSQANLELKPSIRVAILLSIPCIATLILILVAQIPFIILIILVCLHLTLSYKFISKFALLNTPSSIKVVQIIQQHIFLEDKSGQRYLATPLAKNIIHPTFSLLSFDCIKTNNLTAQGDEIEDEFKLYPESNSEIMHTDTINKNTDLLPYKLINLVHDYISTTFLCNNRRHLFICRYNAVNSSAFRRVRVWLRFKA
mgnify:FL=1